MEKEKPPSTTRSTVKADSPVVSQEESTYQVWTCEISPDLHTTDTGKPHKCTVCNRRYTTAEALSFHMYAHKKPNSSGQMKYKADQCDKAFSQPKNLQDHYNDYHAPAPLREKNLKCEQGAEIFMSRDSLDMRVKQKFRVEKKPNSLQSSVCPIWKPFRRVENCKKKSAGTSRCKKVHLRFLPLKMDRSCK